MGLWHMTSDEVFLTVTRSFVLAKVAFGFARQRLFNILFIKAQPAGRLSLPGPSAVLVKQLKTGSCHAE